MIMKPRIKFAKFKKALISEIMYFSGNTFFRQSSMFDESTSHLNHNFAMEFFDDQIWKNLRKNIIQIFSSKLNVVNFFFKLSFSICRSKLLIICSRKFFSNPLHDFLVRIADFDIGMVVGRYISNSRFSVKYSDEETSFSINKPCKISKVGFIIKHVFSYLRRVNHKLNGIKCPL